MTGRLLGCGALAAGLACCARSAPPAPSPPASIPPGAAVTPDAPTPALAPAAPPAFSWKRDPQLEDIPATPLAGQANGRPFDVKTVLFQPGFKSWRIALLDVPIADATGIPQGGQHLILDLPEAPAAGKRWTKPLKLGGGYWLILRKDDPTQHTHWNGPNGFALEITSWEATEYDLSGPALQAAGKASGRIAVTYKGGGGFDDSWVAGTFKDAVVRYMGRPYWLKETPNLPGPPP